jgi:MATE family multidrug resistance protein
MEYVKLPLLSWFVGGICHFALCYYFLFTQDYGLVGIGYACSISNVIVYSMMITYSRMHQEIQVVVCSMFDSRIFKRDGVIDYFKIGIPCVITLCVQWWSFEIAVIITGYFGTLE